MNEIPGWWLGLSAAFFVVNILMFAALAFAGWQFFKFQQRIEPQVKELSSNVHSLIGKVEALTASVQDTVESVGNRTKGIVGSVELITQSASRQFERFSPFIVGAITAMRLIKALNEVRHGKSVAKATKKETLEKRPATVRTKKKKILGMF